MPILPSIGKLWKEAAGVPAVVKRTKSIPPENCFGCGALDQNMERGKSYFSIIINEMYLKEQSKWFNDWDPIVFVFTEFLYNGAETSLPFVVGPAMIKAFREKNAGPPHGIAISDTCVAGPYPYVGGKISVTVILGKMRTGSASRTMLRLLEKVADTIPVGASLAPHLQVADVIFDGADALMGIEDGVKILTGQRWEYDPGRTAWLRPGFFALINRDVDAPGGNELSVRDGRLMADPSEQAASFRGEDFVLYSLNASDTRNDVAALPFYQLFLKARAAAGDPDQASWDRAKASLVTLYQEMLTSPDLIFSQCRQLLGDFKAELLAVKEDANGFAVLSPAQRDQRIAEILQMSGFAVPDQVGEKMESLKESASLLSL